MWGPTTIEPAIHLSFSNQITIIIIEKVYFPHKHILVTSLQSPQET